MVKKSGFLLLLFGLMLLPIFVKPVFAKDYFGVWYVKTYDGKSTSVKLLGWQCLDAKCYKINKSNPVLFYKADAWKNCVLKYYYDKPKLNECLKKYKINFTNSGEKVVVRMQNVPVGQEKTHYAVYFFGENYVGYAGNYAPYCDKDYKYFACGNPNAFKDPENATLTKIQHAYVVINKLQVVNVQDVKKPLEIKVPASISNQVCTSIKKTNIVGYYPPEDGKYIVYSINTQLELIITNDKGEKVHTDALETKIEPDECATQKEFKWTPQTPGKYTIEVIGQIEDPKVVSSTPGKESTTTYVIDPSKSYCYSRIIDLSVETKDRKPIITDKDKINASFKYFSGLFLSNSDIVPLPTKLKITVVNKQNGETIYQKEFTEEAHDNYAFYSQLLGPYSAGDYRITVMGTPISKLCEKVKTNSDVEENDFHVASSEKKYTVTFKIYEKGSGKPLKGVKITLQGPETKTCYTNSNGVCELKVVEGKYTYKLEKKGYHTATGDLNVNTNLDVTYTMTKNDQAPVVNFNSLKQPVVVRIVDSYTLDLRKYIYDPDNKFEDLKIKAKPDKGVTVKINNGIATIKSSQLGNKKVLFIATDPDGKSGQGYVTFKFVPDNPPKIVDSTKAGNYSLKVGQSKTFFVKAVDPDTQDHISFVWYVNNKIVKTENLDTYAGESTYTFKAKSKGMYTIKAVVTDGYLETSVAWTVTVWKKPKDRAPIAIILINGKKVSSIKVPVKTTVYFDGSKSYDPDNEKLTYKWDLNGDGKVDSYKEKTSYTYNKPGKYVVTLTVTDPEGLSGTAKAYVNVVQPNTDKTPPTTKIIVEPKQPNGENGWYTTDVNVSFSCTDKGLGCKATYYCIGSEKCNPVKLYNGKKITVSQEGTIYVKYYSVDKAGNKEKVKEYVIKIDKTPPQIQSVNYPSQETCGKTAEIRVESSDKVSGVDKMILFVDGSPAQQCKASICSFNVKIEKTTKFYIKVYDKAGNHMQSKTMEIKTVCVPHHHPTGGGGGGGYPMAPSPSPSYSGGGGANHINVVTVIKTQKIEKPEIKEVGIPIVIPMKGYKARIEGTPNAEVRVFIDGKFYKDITLNSSGYFDLNISGLSPGYHIMRIYDMNGNLLYTKYFVVKGIPAYVKIQGLKNNALCLELGTETNIQVQFNETGNYLIKIASEEFWLNKTVKATSTDKALIPLVALNLGKYNTEWKIYRDGKLIADFNIPVTVKPNNNLVVKKAKKKKEEKQRITGKLLQFVAKNLKAVLAIILAIIAGFVGYKYWYEKKNIKDKGKKDTNRTKGKVTKTEKKTDQKGKNAEKKDKTKKATATEKKDSKKK